MPVRRPVNQMDHAPLRAVNQHIETLPKAELSHNVICQVPKPIRHVKRSTLLWIARLQPFRLAAQNRAQLTHMQEHNILHSLQRIIRERLAKHPTLPAMNHLVNCIVCVVDARDGREGVVKVRLSKPVPMAVDLMQALDRIHRNKVRRESHMRAILLMQFIDPYMPVPLQAMIELNEGRNRSEKRAGDAR